MILNQKLINSRSEARGKTFWCIPRNSIDPGINKLEMNNLKSSELGGISMNDDSSLLITPLIMTT